MRKILMLLLVVTFSGCYINSNRMFKVPGDFQYTVDQTIGNIEYRIACDDIIQFNIYNNDGYKLIEPMMATTNVNSSVTTSNVEENFISFLVDKEGFVRFPQIGRVKLKDLTIHEAEKLVEEKYSVYYKNPFSQIRVSNRRVMVFNGTGSEGKVVPLKYENTSVIEALASAGGITQTGKAYKIKLVRGDSRNPQVLLIDLSTIEGMKQANLVLQANDIIYVEPTPQISKGILDLILPVVGIVSSIAVVVLVIQGL